MPYALVGVASSSQGIHQNDHDLALITNIPLVIIVGAGRNFPFRY